jgi:peptidoglycan/LPS O-acetylase OafA/YrhL
VAEQTWRDDISGLRGLAFLLVLFYHLDSSVLRSGFLGVDLFFVLSGFLITSAVHQEMVQERSFSITNFIARRAKRLLPTAAFVAVIITILNRWLLEPTRQAGAISDAIKAVTFRTNIEFYERAENYFYSSSQESIFRHYWSLSLEEQYYILFPLVAYVAWRIRGALGLKIALTLIFFGSLAASFYVGSDAGFYLMPFRAWQMAAGGLVALLLTSRRSASKIPQTGAWLSLLVLIASCFTTLADRNIERLVVTFSGCLLLFAMSQDSLLGKMLSSLKKVGERSFSLYLWHWPFILYAKNTNRWGEDGLAVRLAIAVLATFIAAEITYKFIESLRWRPSFSKPSRAIALGAASTLAAFAFLLPQTSATSSQNDVAPPGTTATRPQANTGPIVGSVVGATTDAYLCDGYTTSTSCIVGDEDSVARVLLFGDTAPWSAAISSLAEEKSWHLEIQPGPATRVDIAIRKPSLVIYALPETVTTNMNQVTEVGGVLSALDVPSLFLSHPALGQGPECLETAATYEECASPVPDYTAFSTLVESLKKPLFINTSAWFCGTTCPSVVEGKTLASKDGGFSTEARPLVEKLLYNTISPYVVESIPTLEQAVLSKTLPSKLVDGYAEVIKHDPRFPVCLGGVPRDDECVKFIDPDLPLIAIIGDSHAHQWADVIAQIARTRAYQVIVFPSCMARMQDNLLLDGTPQCEGMEQRLVKVLSALTPEVVITSSKLYTPVSKFDSILEVQYWAASQREFIELLSPYTKSWLVIGDTPELDLHVPDCLSQNKNDITNCGRTRKQATPSLFQAAEKRLVEDLASIRNQQIVYVDPTQWLCNDYCPPARGGLILYRDNNHISVSTAFAHTTKIRAALDPLLGY